MYVGEFGQRGIRTRVNTGDEFQLGFAEVHRDVGMGQCRAELGRMPRPRERSRGSDPEALLLDAAVQCTEFGASADGRERGLEIGHQTGRGPAAMIDGSTSNRAKLSANLVVSATRARS